MDYSITKCLRTEKKRKDGKCPIYIRVGISKGGDIKLPTKFAVEEAKWDDKKKEPKEANVKFQLNKIILEFEKNLKQEIDNDVKLTKQLAKDIYNGKSRVNPKNSSFYDYYTEFLERKEGEGVDKNTIRVYQTTYNILKEFKKTLLISEINLSFVRGFDKYMKEERKNNDGGRYNKHKNLKTVILDLQKHGVKIENPYPLFKIPQPNSKIEFLTLEEIEKISNGISARYTVATGSGRIPTTKWTVLQMFLFSCYTGLRFSDVTALKWEDINIEKKEITLIQKKTKNSVTTPFLQRPEMLLKLNNILKDYKREKRENGYNGNVFKPLSETTVNKRLKEIIQSAGITKPITFHSSRHTYATLLANNGVEVFLISKFLGHKSIKETQRYLHQLKCSALDIDRLNKIFNESH